MSRPSTLIFLFLSLFTALGSLEMCSLKGLHGRNFATGVSKHSTVALLCYFLPQWCYFSFLVMKDAARRAEHGATAAVTCATAKSSLDTPVQEVR